MSRKLAKPCSDSSPTPQYSSLWQHWAVVDAGLASWYGGCRSWERQSPSKTWSMGSATRIASHKACTWTPLWGKVSFTVGLLYPCRAQKTKNITKKSSPQLSGSREGNNLLGWRVCRTNFARKIFFVLRNFSRKMHRNFPRYFWALTLWSRKNPAKFPTNFPPNFPPKNSKKFTDELLQERRENNFHWNWNFPLRQAARERMFQNPL